MESIETTLIRLERALLDPEVRSNSQRLNTLLAEDFIEVGATGRAFGKADVLSRLPNESGITFTATEIQAYLLSPTVALLTYLATRSHAGETTHSRRSSVWVLSSHGWQMRYHQGTNDASVAA